MNNSKVDATVAPVPAAGKEKEIIMVVDLSYRRRRLMSLYGMLLFILVPFLTDLEEEMVCLHAD